MRELTADMFISVDGFAAGVNQPAFFGFFGPELANWVREQIDQPQTMIMGRVTYQALSKISASASDESSLKMTSLAKLVFSSTLREPLAWKNTRVVTGDLVQEVQALKNSSGDPLRSIGSITLVRSMILHGLIDRLRIMVFPLTLGDAGREPMYAGYPMTKLELLDTKVLDSRLLLLEYRPVRGSVV